MVQIERVSEDRLTRQIWKFAIFAPRFGRTNVVNAIVDYYAIEERPSTRHKWRVEPSRRFSEWDRRAYHSGITAQDVPLPEDVMSEVQASLVIAVHAPTVDRRDIL